ncbi:PaaI family thioesterase [Kallotenue papyrolyticum]|uniref:PaaI family thioesterase n=1 Tax=Kallotenue papyrolyticum TaxID=1325125 RepID=UPI000492BC32|nr:PaaI family thioesterase [Kallotenue papyrolyticum]
MLKQPDSNNCFICGKQNPYGLQLDFTEVDGRVETSFTPQPQHQGWPGFLHGGILFAVLDETLGRVGFTIDAWTMSGRVEIRYREPAPIGEPLRVVASLVRDRGRALEVAGVAQLPDGRVVAEATGLYMRIPDHLRRPLEEQIAEGF